MAGNAITQPGWNPLVADQHWQCGDCFYSRAGPKACGLKWPTSFQQPGKLKIVVTRATAFGLRSGQGIVRAGRGGA